MVKHGGEWSTRELASVVGEFGLRPLGFSAVRRAWRVETGDGPRFLKCTRLTPPELHFVSEALAYLRLRGEPAPRLHVDRLGRPWVRRGGYAFVLTDWCDGREADFRDSAELERAVRTVARLHRRGEGFQPSRSGYARVEWGRWPEKFGRRARQLEGFRAAALKSGEPFDREYLALWPHHAAQAGRALKLFERSAYPWLTAARLRRPVICHHDLSQRNFLRADGADEALTLVDFDYCVYDLPLHDLANLLWHQVKGEWDPAPARRVLTAYDRFHGLSREERRLLLALLTWPHRYWLLGWQRYVERRPWPEERWRESVARRTEEAWRREGFLSTMSEDLEAGRP